MSTDLTIVKDHPAVIFDRLSTAALAGEIEDGTAHHGSMAFRAASTVIRGYEETAQVTFAALDSETLGRVQYLYDNDPDSTPGRPVNFRPDEFIREVALLLGLD